MTTITQEAPFISQEIVNRENRANIFQGVLSLIALTGILASLSGVAFGTMGTITRQEGMSLSLCGFLVGLASTIVIVKTPPKFGKWLIGYGVALAAIIVLFISLNAHPTPTPEPVTNQPAIVNPTTVTEPAPLEQLNLLK